LGDAHLEKYSLAPNHMLKPVVEEALVEARQVSLDFYGARVLEGVNFTIAQSEIVCIIGPSGCGKTTLLRVIAGLIPPTVGGVLVGGVPVTGPRRDIAVVFQDYSKALLPWRNAYGNVALALEAMHVPHREQKERIEQLLELVGLTNHAQKYPRQLSGGMQQRLQIARALAQEPRLLLMDEPFGALDAMTRQSLQDEILSIAERTRKTIVFVTHDLEEAIYIGDRVFGLLPHPGRLARDFPVDLARPRDQLLTRENPTFLTSRRELFDFIHMAER
jgi:NitT/TauT family transport system ATP-binding protein